MAQTKSKTKSSGTKASGKKSSSATKSSYSRSVLSKRKPSRPASGKQSASLSAGELDKFFYDSLKDIYWAEKHLTKALPKMSKAATSKELSAALLEHRDVTEGHIARLEQVFELIGKKAQAKKCEAMAGLTKEADEVLEETEKGSSTRDVGIIISAQKVEHYEIAAYGGLAQLAKTMGLAEVSGILGQTLAEEKEADQSLTTIAENNINLQAEEEGKEDEEE